MTEPSLRTARVVLTLVFSAFGLAMGVMSGALAPLARAADVDTSSFGLSMTVYMVAYMVAMTGGGYVMSRISAGRLLVLVVAMMGLSLVGLMLARTPASYFAAFAVYAAFGGIVDLAMNAEIASVERRLGRPIMAFTHGLASVGYAIGTTLGSQIAVNVGLLMVGLVGAAGLWLAAVAVLVALPHRPAVGSGSRVHGFPFSLALVLLGVVFGIDSAGEMTAGLWSGKAIEEISLELAEFGGVGASVYAGLQAVTRIFGDLPRRWFGDLRVVMISLAIGIAGFTVIGLSGGLTAKLLGFALVGIGTGLTVPCCFALAAAQRPQMAAAAMSTMSLIASAPRVLFPVAFGELAARTSVSTGFLSVAVLFAVAFTTMIVARTQKRS